MTMRISLFARMLSMAALAACDVEVAEDVDALAVDAGVDADADGGLTAAVARTSALAPVEAPVAAAPVASEIADAEQLGALTMLSGRLGMVMDLGEGRAVGAITRISDRRSGTVVLRRAHAPSEDEQALVGAPVALYQADGLACRATIERIVQVASVVPAEGTRHGDRALWRIAEEKNGIAVIGELSAPGCQDPIFVEQGESPRAAAPPRRAAEGSAVEIDAIARLKALPRFAELEASFRKSHDADATLADWSALPDSGAQVFELSLAGRRYVIGELTREGHCGAFGGTVFAIWERGADGALRLRVDAPFAPSGYDLAVDDDHDGVPELAAIAGEIEPALEAEQHQGCGC
jgi:hypothetical protein